MPPKNPWQYDVNQLDNKGLDVIHPIEQVPKGFYSRMENVKSLQEGTITVRPGTSLINAAAFDLTGFLAPTLSETEQGCGTVAALLSSGSGDGVKGAYVTVIAATERISKFWVFTFIQSAGLPDLGVVASVDISFDAGSGPEVDFISGHSWHAARKSTSPLTTGDTFEFPFEIPAGSRIRARIEDDNASVRTYGFTASMAG